MKFVLKKDTQVIAVVGPTATGKSAYAVEIAKQFKAAGKKAAIISADSRQVYKFLNIGSGKVTKKEMGGIPHYMLDVVHPRTTFSVVAFVKKAEKIINELLTKNIVPIVCGGTGFYIDALLRGLTFPEVKPNKELRAKLEQMSNEDLFKILLKKDKERAEHIDAKNKVRLVRALEIIEELGKVPAIQKTQPKYQTQWIGLNTTDDILKQKIHTRLSARMKQGMLAETTKLHANEKVSWKRLESLGLEYKYMALIAQKKISVEQALTQLEIEIWQYAKRQRMWFKRNKEIEWIEVD